jgi:hypothetical protein
VGAIAQVSNGLYRRHAESNGAMSLMRYAGVISKWEQ